MSAKEVNVDKPNMNAGYNTCSSDLAMWVNFLLSLDWDERKFNNNDIVNHKKGK